MHNTQSILALLEQHPWIIAILAISIVIPITTLLIFDKRKDKNK